MNRCASDHDCIAIAISFSKILICSGKYRKERLITQPDLTMEKLPLSFYQRTDVLQVARELMGKILVTKWNRLTTSGRIVECEAYAGAPDRASHAFGGRRTARNEIMYGDGGYAY